MREVLLEMTTNYLVGKLPIATISSIVPIIVDGLIENRDIVINALCEPKEEIKNETSCI